MKVFGLKRISAFVLAFCLIVTGLFVPTDVQAAGLKSVTVKTSDVKVKKGVKAARFTGKTYNNMKVPKKLAGKQVILSDTNVKGYLTVYGAGKTSKKINKIKLQKDSYVGKIVANGNVSVTNNDSIIRCLSIRNGASKVKLYGRASSVSVPSKTKNARADIYASVPKVTNKGKNVKVVFHKSKVGNYTSIGSGNTNYINGKTAALFKITGSKNKTTVKNAEIGKVYDTGAKNKLLIDKSRIHNVTFGGKAGSSMTVTGSSICNMTLKDKGATIKLTNTTVEHLYAPDGTVLIINGQKVTVYGNKTSVIYDGSVVVVKTKDASGKDAEYTIDSNTNSKPDPKPDDNTGSGDSNNGGNTDNPGGNTGDNTGGNNGGGSGDNGSSGNENPGGGGNSGGGGGTGGGSAHVHNYIESITKQPTCDKPGEKTLTCSCGSMKQESIPAKGHIPGNDYIVDKEPTDTENGVKSKHCTVCGAVIAGTEVSYPKDTGNTGSGNTGTGSGDTGSGDKHEHVYTESITKEPGCETEGEKKLVCSCGDTKTEVIPAKGHTAGDDYVVDKEPTDTEDGSKSKHCVDCGKPIEGTSVTVPATGSGSGNTGSGDEKPDHVHKYVETITKEPGCETEGEKKLTCECGDTKTESVPAKGHTPSEDYVVDKEATGSEEGSKSKHCTECGQIIPGTELTIPVLHEHKYTEEVTKQPTCTEEGEKTLTCECGDVKTESIPVSHNYIYGKAYWYDFQKNGYIAEPTWNFTNIKGSKYYMMSAKLEVTKPVMIHVELKLDKDADQFLFNDYNFPTTVGIYHYDFEITPENNSFEAIFLPGQDDVTGYLKFETPDSYGHVCSKCLKIEDHTMENGKCTVCGWSEPCTEHHYVETITKEPTCTEDGEKKLVCDKCVDTKTEVVSATGHHYVDGICSDCGDVADLSKEPADVSWEYTLDQENDIITLNSYIGTDSNVYVYSQYKVDGDDTIYNTRIKGNGLFENNSTVTSVTFLMIL